MGGGIVLFGDIYVNMYGGGHTVLGCEKTTVISASSLPVEMGVLVAILQISCNTINLNLTCISNYLRFLILFFIIHSVRKLLVLLIKV